MTTILELQAAGRLLVDYAGDYWEILPESDRVLGQLDNWRANGSEHVFVREVPHSGSTGASRTRGPRGVYEVMLWSGPGVAGTLQPGAMFRALVRAGARWYEELSEQADAEIAAIAILSDELAALIAEHSTPPEPESADERDEREAKLRALRAERRTLPDRLERAQMARRRARVGADVAAGFDAELPVDEMERRIDASLEAQ